MGDLGIPRQWRLAKTEAEPNEGRRAPDCAPSSAATGAAVKAATAARLSLFLCFYRWSSCCRAATTAKPCGGDGAAAAAVEAAVGCQLDFGVLVLKQILKKITRGDFVIWSNIVKSLSSNQKDAVLIWLTKNLFEKLKNWELQLHLKLEKQISSRKNNWCYMYETFFWFSLTPNPTFIIYSDFKQKESLETSIFQRFHTSFKTKFVLLLLIDLYFFFQNSIRTWKEIKHH